MSDNTCPYCETETIGEYCHVCGQKQGVNRLKWRHLFEDLQKRLFGFDNNFFRTLKDLTIRPGKVIDSTIEGIRIRYIGPVGYFFLMVTIFVLLMSILDVDMFDLSKGIKSTVNSGNTAEQEKLQRAVGQSIFGNFRVASFLMMPFYILGVHLIFKNKKYNFLETSVLMFYAQGHSMIFSIFAMFAYWAFSYSNAMLLVSPFSFAYMAFVCANFYQGNVIWNFIKGLLGILLGIILLMIIAMIGGIIYVIINPEVAKQLAPPG